MIAGHGPDEKKVIKLIEQYHLQNKVRLIGPIYDEKKETVFSKTLYVAFPSRHDEICLATLEVLAAGLPVAAFDLPESKWLIQDVALKAKSYDTELYSQLLLKMTDPVLNSAMKKNAREFAKKYTWDKVVSDFENFFQEVISKEKLN